MCVFWPLLYPAFYTQPFQFFVTMRPNIKHKTQWLFFSWFQYIYSSWKNNHIQINAGEDMNYFEF